MKLFLSPVDLDAAEASRVLGSGRKLELAEPGGSPFQLSLSPCQEFSCLPPTGLGIATDLGRLCFHGDGELLLLLGGIAPPHEAEHWHTAIALSLARWPRALLNVTGVPSLTESSSIERAMPVCLSLQRDDVSARACVSAPPEVWIRMARVMSPLAFSFSSRARVAFPLLVGTARIVPTALQALSVGDVIRFKTTAFGPDGRGQLCIAGMTFRARLSLAGPRPSLHIDSLTAASSHLPPDMAELQTSDTPPEPAPPSQESVVALANPGEDTPAAVAAESLKLDVVAELEHLRCTLGELQALGPGVVLEIGPRSNSEVTLRLRDGDAFARGELVDVGGRLGVRITRLVVL